MKLFLQALSKFILGVLFTALVLFIPAGTTHYWNAWLLMALLFIPMFISGTILIFKNPSLLKSRLNAKEAQQEQKVVVALTGLMFISGFIVCGLDYRFHWTVLPSWVIIVAGVLFLFAYLLYGEVLRENTYLSRTIQVQEHQTIIDTGVYSIVRHPMYTSTLCLFIAMPLILGSWWGFILFLLYPFIIIKRILNEEKILEQELNGYTEYKQRVKYRLIPFIW